MIFMSKTKGFTLIELLVVIAIIGLLAMIAVMSFKDSQAKARDAKRIGDLEALSKAASLILSNRGTVPNTTSGWSNLSSDFSPYLQSVMPTDPTNIMVNGTRYRYVYCWDNTNKDRYFLLTVLEKPLSGVTSRPIPSAVES